VALRIAVYRQLDSLTVAAVRTVIHAANLHDDLAPLSEHVLFNLTHPRDGSDEHVVAREGENVVGYLHVDRTDGVAGPAVELVVHPEYRRRGIATSLINTAIKRAGDPRLRLWAHGELAPAYALANTLGFTKTRELWQMRRSLHGALPKAAARTEFGIRPFQPSKDEAAWLDLNAQVFAEHPEQGRLNRHDLELRMAESWFDPEGFLIAQRDGVMVGFHWIKVNAAIGEIYVLGVAPSERGTGLGRLLAVRGLEYMRGRDLDAAMLYVDADNHPARRLYETLGFLHWDTDVMFGRAAG
jgi:mycothiol synthase